MREGDANVVDWQVWEDWNPEPKVPDDMKPGGPWYPFAVAYQPTGRGLGGLSCEHDRLLGLEVDLCGVHADAETLDDLTGAARWCGGEAAGGSGGEVLHRR